MTAILAALLGLLSFAFYLHGLYPSVSVGDSGEFITAAWTLGVPHAPGYPTYTLLGHLFADLVPFGNPAYRLNLFSAATASLAISLFFLMLNRAGVRRSAALGCAVILMFSGALAANARAGEVFALNALFLIAILYAALSRQWLLAFFLTGLGAGNHQILLFVLPALALSLWTESGPHPQRAQLMACAGFLFVGCLLYAALLLRAQKVPFLNVGNPQTVARLWRVVTRADYGSLTLALGETPERSLWNTLLQLQRLGMGLLRQSSWPLLLLAFAGGAWAAAHSRRMLCLVGLEFLMLGPVFFLMGNLPFDAQSNGLLVRFLIAPAIGLIFLSAWGFESLFRKNRWLALALLIVCVGWQTARADWLGFRHDTIAYSYGRNNLRTLAPASIFIMDGGDDTFYTLAYLTQVEARRTDIAMHDRGGVVFANPYGADFRSLSREDKEARRQAIEQALASSGRPLYYSTMNPHVLPTVALHQDGILYKAGAASSHDLWPLYDLRGVEPWDVAMPSVSGDYRTRALTPYYAYQKAVDLTTQGHPDASWGFLKSALSTGYDVVWLIPNLMMAASVSAYNAFIAHDYRLARDLYAWILATQPNDADARRNLQIVTNQMHV